MADGRDLQNALEKARLRISAVDEQLIMNSFLSLEKKIADFISREERPREAREPYEIN